MMKKARKQVIGLGFTLLACVVFWLPLYKIKTYVLFIPIKSTLTLVPGLASSVIALVLVFLLYARGIISFKSKRYRLISLLINWAVFATFFEIILFPINTSSYDFILDNYTLLVSLVAFVSVLLFGLKEIAKVASLAFTNMCFFSNIMVVNNAMGSWGFMALALLIVGFYFQENIQLKTLKDEVHYLYKG